MKTEDHKYLLKEYHEKPFCGCILLNCSGKLQIIKDVLSLRQINEESSLGEARKRRHTRQGRTRFPSFLSEKPSSSLVLDKITRSWLASLPLEMHRKVHASEARVRPSKCTRNDGARCCTLQVCGIFSSEGDMPPFEREKRRKETLVVFPFSVEGLDKGKGNQTKRNPRLKRDMTFRVGRSICLKTVNPFCIVA